MKRTLIHAATLATAIAAVLGAPAFAQEMPARTPEQVARDAAITATVKTSLLADTRTDGFDVDVDTHAGIVTLNGQADSIRDKVAASELAFAVSGVSAVANRLAVSAPVATAVAVGTPPSSGRVRPTLEDMDGDGVDEVGPGPDADVDNFQDLDNDGVDEVGPGPDAELNNVSDLDGDGVDEVGPGPDAKVDLSDTDNDGVDEVGPGPDAELNNVSDLDGDGVDEVGPGPDAKVNDVADMDRDGVDEVDDANDLVGDKVDDDRLGDGTGGPSDAIDDAWITSKVKSQFLADTAVEGLEIDVDTQANVVTLSGSVDTAAQREAAIRIATATQGVHKVVADALIVAAD